MAIVTIDPKDVRVTIGGQPVEGFASGAVRQFSAVAAQFTIHVQEARDAFGRVDAAFNRLGDAARRRAMAARGYAMAPQRKRPRRLSKKIRARFGVAHHRDYHRELVRWINANRET